MKVSTKIGLILLFLLGIIVVSCQKFDDFPPEPRIEYQSFLLEFNTQTGITERGVLAISYTDGDGDIGLRPRDTFPPYNFGSKYYYNLIIDYYEMQFGEWIKVPLVTWNPDKQEYDTLTFNARMPILTPPSGAQPIKGTIQDTLYIYNPLSEFDTIKFSAYIVDRALNESNTVETPPIVRVSE
jgi:hypothetical protein